MGPRRDASSIGPSSYAVLTLECGAQIVIARYGSAIECPQLIVLHGLKGSSRGVEGIVKEVVRDGISVVVINLPGMGISPVIPGVYKDVEATAKTLEEAIIGVSGAKGIVLLGHSFGATLASVIASRGKVPILGMILVSPIVTPVGRDSGFRGVLSRALIKSAVAILRAYPLALAEIAVRSQLWSFTNNAFLARRGLKGLRRVCALSSLERGLSADPRSVADQLDITGRHGCVEYARGLTIPVFIVSGDRDSLSSLDGLRRLEAELRRGSLSIIDGGGHLIHHEDTGTVGNLIHGNTLALLMSRDSSSEVS